MTLGRALQPAWRCSDGSAAARGASRRQSRPPPPLQPKAARSGLSRQPAPSSQVCLALKGLGKFASSASHDWANLHLAHHMNLVEHVLRSLLWRVGTQLYLHFLTDVSIVMQAPERTPSQPLVFTLQVTSIFPPETRMPLPHLALCHTWTTRRPCCIIAALLARL